MKRIRITLKRQKISAVAELFEDVTPKTCKGILSVLPIETTLRHSQFIGHFVWCNLVPSGEPTKELKDVPCMPTHFPENYSKYPLPGELAYGIGVPAWEGGERGSSSTIYDFLICYGPDSHFRMDLPIGMAIFGVVIEGFKDLATGLQNLTKLGEEPIRIELLKGDFPPSEERLIPARWGHYAKGGALSKA